jgi:hypothetical protein
VRANDGMRFRTCAARARLAVDDMTRG